MGTRSVTNVVNETGEVFVSLYRQYDGYPQGGHGEELAGWLEGAEIGNGIGGNVAPKYFNGMGDLALRLVTFFREDHTQIGGFYLIPPGTDWGVDFTYTVKEDGVRVVVKVELYGKTKFEGTVEDLIVWMKSDDDDD